MRKSLLNEGDEIMKILIPKDSCQECLFYDFENSWCQLFRLEKLEIDASFYNDSKFEECIDAFGKDGGTYELIKEVK